MRIAIIHDWLVTYAGAERVLEKMLHIFPESDLFCLIDFLPIDKREFILNKETNTSFIQKLPFARTRYRNYLPLMPLAIEQFDLSSYDIVISSSHAVAKGVITGPDQLHLCMCYSPIRYAWDLQHQYLIESNLIGGVKSWFVRWVLHRIRGWDLQTANGVNEFIAISNFISRRIWKVYRRNSKVIYPPVDISAFTLWTKKDVYYLTSSRMVPYKKIDLIVDAFRVMPDQKLIVIGEGPDFNKIKAKAGPNVTMLGYQPYDQLKRYMQNAKAFIFAAEEDFGIAPLEAQACGTPVIAFGKGAALETIIGESDKKDQTGVFFYEQSISSICNAVKRFEKIINQITPEACRKNAERFSPEHFNVEFKEFVENSYQEFCERYSLHPKSFVE